MKQIKLKNGIYKVSCCNECPIIEISESGGLECGITDTFDIFDSDLIPKKCPLEDYTNNKNGSPPNYRESNARCCYTCNNFEDIEGDGTINCKLYPKSMTYGYYICDNWCEE